MLNALFRKETKLIQMHGSQMHMFFQVLHRASFGKEWLEEKKINFQVVIQTWNIKAAETLTAEEHVTTKNLFWSWTQHKKFSIVSSWLGPDWGSICTEWRCHGMGLDSQKLATNGDVVVRSTNPSVTSWRIACGQGEDRFQLAGSLSDTMLRRSTFQSNTSTEIFGSQEAKGTRILDVKHDVCIVWIVLENFDFTHIRLIRLWILHDFTMSCQVHQRLWIPGKVPPRWGFYGPPWDARRCLMEKTCDDNRWCQMTQCWWRSFQILLKYSTIFSMLSIWECEKSEPSLSHVRFLVGDGPNRPALPWLEFC